MSLKTEQVQMKLSIEGKQALNELSVLEKATDELSASNSDLRKKLQDNEKAMKKLAKSSPEYQKLKAQNKEYSKTITDNSSAIEVNKQKIDQLRNSQGDQLRLTSSLKKEQGELAKSMQRMTRETEDWNKANERSIQISQELDRRKAEDNARRAEPKSWLSNIKTELPAAFVGGIAGALVGTVGMVLGDVLSGIEQKVEKIAKKADAISDLKLAFNGTTQEAKELDAELAKIVNRLGPQTLRKIATEAGKLGVPTEEITAYTEAIGQAAVAMESDFPAGADVLTEKLTKIKGLYSDTKAMNYPESVYKIASAMKVLADDGTATAKWQSEFLLKLGQLPEKVRPTVKELMGMGAALEEAGLTDDIAASGITGVLTAAMRNTEGFGKLFGMTKKEFEGFINLHPNDFLLQLAERLKQMSGPQAAQALHNLKVESMESFKALGTLSNNIEKVKNKQLQSNEAVERGSRLTEIFTEKNDNLAGKLERANQVMSKTFNNSFLVEGIEILTKAYANVMILMEDVENQAEQLALQFDDQKRKVDNLQKNIVPLISRYDQLKSKSKLSKEEQAELKEIITQVTAVIPNAAQGMDIYGRALSLNTAKAREFIETEKIRLAMVNETSIKEWALRLKSTKLGIEAVHRALNTRDEKGDLIREKITRYGTVTQYKLTQKEIDALQNKLKKLHAEARGARAQIYNLTGTPLPGLPAEKPEEDKNGLDGFDPDDLKVDKSGGKSEEEKAAEREIRRINRLAAIRIRMMKEGEEKEIMQRTLAHAQELQELVKEEGDKTELYKALESERQRDVDEITEKWKRKRELETKVVEDRITAAKNRVLEQRLQIDLADAQKVANNEEGIYQAQLLLSKQRETTELDQLRATYRKQQEELKDNGEALKKLDEEYNQGRIAIQERYGNERLDNERERNRISRDRQKAATRESLQLDVNAAQFGGNEEKILSAQLALIDHIQAEELKVANLTEQEKTNILRRHQQERDALITNHLKNQAVQILESFQTGIQTFAQMQQVSFQNEETRNHDAQQRQTDRLDKQLKQGIITQEQYQAKKDQLDQRSEEKARALRKKQAIEEKKTALFTAALQIPLAILKASPNPIAMAVAGVVGAAQLAMINAREIPEYYEGGLPPLNGHDGQIIRVNERNKQEQITPNWQIMDPATAPMLKYLEYRRANRITGYNGPPPEEFGVRSSAADQQPVVVVQQSDPEMKQLLRDLSQNGVHARMSWDRYEEDTSVIDSIRRDAMA